MKWLVGVLVLLLLGLQYRLWVGEGSVAHYMSLEKEIEKQRAENDRLVERNKLLEAEVEALKTGTDAVEEKARHDMGMIKEDETFYLIVDEQKNKKKDNQ